MSAIQGTRVRRLDCCCCGGLALGRQWHNRDTGYGICGDCITWFRATGRQSEAEIRDYYGIEGVHFNCEVMEATVAAIREDTP